MPIKKEADVRKALRASAEAHGKLIYGHEFASGGDDGFPDFSIWVASGPILIEAKCGDFKGTQLKFVTRKSQYEVGEQLASVGHPPIFVIGVRGTDSCLITSFANVSKGDVGLHNSVSAPNDNGLVLSILAADLFLKGETK